MNSHQQPKGRIAILPFGNPIAKGRREAACLEIIKDIPIRDLIFLDESGANLRMAPLYGRASGSERVVEAVPFNRGNRLTILSAISFTKVEAALYGEWVAEYIIIDCSVRKAEILKELAQKEISFVGLYGETHIEENTKLKDIAIQKFLKL